MTVKSKVSRMNKKRAGWAKKALINFCQSTGQSLRTPEDMKEVVTDFLTDLQHLLHQHNEQKILPEEVIWFTDCINKSFGHWREEMKEGD